MRFRTYLLFLVPMGVDGLLQLLGVRESDWIWRTVTGVCFGVGSVLYAYPYLEDGFADVRQNLERKLSRT